MFKTLKFLFIFSGFVSFLQFISSNYINSDFYGNLLEQTGFNFSIFIKSFRGIILYSIDTNYNRLLIELDNDYSGDIFIIKFNYNSTAETLWSLHICGCRTCSDVFITFILLLYKSQIDINCQQKSSSIRLDHWSQKDQFKDYPIPKDFKQKNYEAFFMIGNIGPYKGELQYYALRNQLSGCLETFYFNGKLVLFKGNNLYVLPTCDIIYTEENIFRGIRKNSTTVYKMYDCSVLSMNGHYCNKINNNFQLFHRTYKNILDNNKHTYFRFEWETLINKFQIKPYCLIEILLKDETFLFFPINYDNNLRMISLQNKSNDIEIKFRQAIPENTKHILLIYFQEDFLIIKIYDGEIIRIYRQYLQTTFVLVNVGVCKHSSKYSKFQGNFSFKYNTDSWFHPDNVPILTTTPEPKTPSNLTTIIIIQLIGGIIIIIIITAVAILIIFRLKKKEKSGGNDNRNRNKTPSPNHYELELTEAQNKGNIYERTFDNDKPPEENDDHNGYAIVL